jgi:hypothetical protein
MATQLLGTGLLSWPNNERIAGRYGIVTLFRTANIDEGERGLQGLPWNVDVDALVGKHGALSAYLPDGHEVVLGSGTFFTERDYGLTYVGLKPDEPREEDWLDPVMLHKVDAYMIRKPIELYFVTGED